MTENLVVSSGNGFTSWPPLADDACTTPFVILGRKSNALVCAKPAATATFSVDIATGQVR